MRLVRLLPDPTSIHALQRYTEKLDEIERLHEHALRRGIQHRSTDTDRGQEQLVRSLRDQQIIRESKEPDNREHEPSVNEDPHNGPPSHEGVISRKRGPDESLFAFNHPSNVRHPIDPKLELTLKLRNNYALDLKMSKQAVLGFPRCPLLPDSLWNDVLLDRYVDFDKILTGYYALESDHRETQSFGNLDISLNTGGSSGKMSKEIRIYGEWSIAYARYTRAVVFVYPHRNRELEDYEEYLAGQFAAYPDIADQFKIINFDKAIRIRVRQSNDLMLTDIARFQDIISYHLINPKTSRPNDAKRQKLTANDDIPICRRWNTGRCVAATCSYLHICHHCNGKHQAKDCTTERPGAKKD